MAPIEDMFHVKDDTIVQESTTRERSDQNLGSILRNRLGVMCSDNFMDGDPMWTTREAYDFAKPSFDYEAKQSIRRSMEPKNYVRALLRSDTELEMLSRKIRSQLRQSEMVELAKEAEIAADSGKERFSAQPSTFGEPSKDKVEPKRSNNTRRHTSTRKLKVLELRDVTEVIPHFRDLHLHTRTHMRRRRVDEEALSFHEVECKEEKLPLQMASDLATRSMTLLEDNISNVHLVTQRLSQNLMDRSGACSSNFCGAVLGDKDNNKLRNSDVDKSNNSHFAASSQAGRFGGALSAHLTPESGRQIQRPPLFVPIGLSHPDKQYNVSRIDDMRDHSLLAEDTSGSQRRRLRSIDRSQSMIVRGGPRSQFPSADSSSSDDTGGSRLNNNVDATVHSAPELFEKTAEGDDSRIESSHDGFLRHGIALAAMTQRVRNNETELTSASQDDSGIIDTSSSDDDENEPFKADNDTIEPTRIRNEATSYIASSHQVPTNIDDGRIHCIDKLEIECSSRIRNEQSTPETARTSLETPETAAENDEMLDTSIRIDGPSAAVTSSLFETPKKANTYGSIVDDNDEVDSDDESLEFGISLAQRTNATALFDSDADDGSTCTPLHSEIYGGGGGHAGDAGMCSDYHHCDKDLDLQLTPNHREPPKPEKQFLTPAHLRRMRDWITPSKNHENKLTTPETEKCSICEPNSIVATSENDIVKNQERNGMNHTAAFLALPSMRITPEKKFTKRSKVFPESTERRRLNYPKPPAFQNLNVPTTNSRPTPDRTETCDNKMTTNRPPQKAMGDSFRWELQPRRRLRRPRSPTAVLETSRNERRQDDSSDPTVSSSSAGKEKPDPLRSSEFSRVDSTSKANGDLDCPAVPSNETPQYSSDSNRRDGNDDKTQQSSVACPPVPSDAYLQQTTITSDSTVIGESSTVKSENCGGADSTSALAPGTGGKSHGGFSSFEEYLQPIKMASDVCRNRATTVKEEAAPRHVKSKSEQTFFESFSWSRMRQIATKDDDNNDDQDCQSLPHAMSWPLQNKKPSVERDLIGVTIRGVRSMPDDHNAELSGGGGMAFNGFGWEKSPTREEGFQRAVEEIIANLTPLQSKRLQENYVTDFENNEFLNNYYYCVKPNNGRTDTPRSQDVESYNCTREALCSNIGIDTVMCGLKFLGFPVDKAKTPPDHNQLPSKPAPIKARALSLGDEDFDYENSWLGMFGIKSRRFNRKRSNDGEDCDDDGNERVFRFQPPYLKKTCNGISKPLEDEKGNNIPGLQEASNSVSADIEASKHKDIFKMTESKDGCSMTNNQRWNLIQRCSHESYDLDGDDSSMY